jgi:hypothetical protein
MRAHRLNFLFLFIAGSDRHELQLHNLYNRSRVATIAAKKRLSDAEVAYYDVIMT